MLQKEWRRQNRKHKNQGYNWKHLGGQPLIRKLTRKSLNILYIYLCCLFLYTCINILATCVHPELTGLQIRVYTKNNKAMWKE